MVLFNCDWKNWCLTKINGLGRFGPKKAVLVNFDRTNVILVDSGSVFFVDF